ITRRLSASDVGAFTGAKSIVRVVVGVDDPPSAPLPCGPVAPVAPLEPFVPFEPEGPVAPLEPLDPLEPFVPDGPGSPLSPPHAGTAVAVTRPTQSARGKTLVSKRNMRTPFRWRASCSSARR